MVKRFILPPRLTAFFKEESAGGVVMIVAAALALFFANSGLSAWYEELVHLPLGASFGEITFQSSLSHWVKDVLMVLFFWLIGMELKREMVDGVLADKKQILLPLVAAVGGMVAPALVYLLINAAHPEHLAGWAIPSATDIAFAVCVLTLIGKSVPPALKIFLLAVAIFDDLGAILIIALFYNSELVVMPLFLALAATGALLVMARKITWVMPYILMLVVLWYLLHIGGIHTTLAGVIVGLTMPMKTLEKAMHFLHPWVAFLILPIFAFTTAGVDIRGLSAADLLSPLPLGIALGLFFGKQIGILGAAWLLIRLKFASLPQEVNWRQMYGVSVVAGIGFTMSLFIGLLAFTDVHLQDQAKIGVMAGSLLASFWGFLVLRKFTIREGLTINRE